MKQKIKVQGKPETRFVQQLSLALAENYHAALSQNIKRGIAASKVRRSQGNRRKQ